MSINRHIVRSTFVGALGGLLFGFDTAVIAGVTLYLTAQYSLSTRMLELTVGIALIGTILGAISSGTLGQCLGSRESLRIVAGSTLCGLRIGLRVRMELAGATGLPFYWWTGHWRFFGVGPCLHCELAPSPAVYRR